MNGRKPTPWTTPRTVIAARRAFVVGSIDLNTVRQMQAGGNGHGGVLGKLLAVKATAEPCNQTRSSRTTTDRFATPPAVSSCTALSIEAAKASASAKVRGTRPNNSGDTGWSSRNSSMMASFTAQATVSFVADNGPPRGIPGGPSVRIQNFGNCKLKGPEAALSTAVFSVLRNSIAKMGRMNKVLALGKMRIKAA